MLITVTKLAALQHEKECIHSLRVGENEHINSLRDTRGKLVIRLASDDVARNASLVNVITIEIKKINEENNELMLLLNRGKEEIHKRCNHSPV